VTATSTHWRGVSVTRAETKWMIQRRATDLTSRSLQADATSRSFRDGDGEPQTFSA